MTDECGRVDAVADELVLATLSGLDRARALAHLEECHACRTEIATLSEAADAVLLLAPAAAPDPDFERRVLDRISHAAMDEPAAARQPLAVATGRRRRRLSAVLAAAAVVAVIVAASLVWAAQRAPDAVAASMVDGRGDPVGRVSLVADHGTAVQMDLPGWDNLRGQYGGAAGERYLLEITLDDGSQASVPLPPHDAGKWRVTTPVGRSRIVGVAIADQHGYPWCHAEFT